MNLNQNNWQPLAAEHLVQLGKNAAQTAETSGISLTDAVVRSIGMTKLNEQQVRRVVEAANHEAFHQKYAAMDSRMRVVDLEGGPADLAAVTERLALLAAPHKVAQYRNDYSLGPQYPVSSTPYVASTTKTAALEGAVELQERLNALHEELIGQMHAKQAGVESTLNRVTHHVRQALADGAYYEDIARAWGHYNPKYATELASSFSLPKAPAGVKTASREIPKEHPLVTTFVDFMKVAKEYETICDSIREVEKQLVRVDDHLRSNA